MVLNFENDKLIKELKKIKPKKVLVQLPEGVKQNAFEIKKLIEGLGIEVVFSGDTCWGGCSINPSEAKTVGADLIIHYGHAEFIKSNFPILYIEIKDELDVEPLLEKSLDKIMNYKNISISFSIQHRQDIENIIQFYKSHGKNIILSQKKGYAAYGGHVIGCEFSGLKAIQDKVDAFLIIGNNFHSMGASLAVDKPVILVDVYNDEVSDMIKIRDKIIKQRIISIDKFKRANKVGIIVEEKVGQKFGSPTFLKEKLEKAGKEVIVITMNEITPDKLMNFYNVEAFVELGCPRIALDDYSKYPKTLVTFREALVAIGEKSFDDALKEGLI